METVGTRELKQNPQSVIRRVLETGAEIEITSHGQPTGVRMVPDRPRPKRWIGGGALNALPPMDPAAAARWLQDIERVEDGGVTDPWSQP